MVIADLIAKASAGLGNLGLLTFSVRDHFPFGRIVWGVLIGGVDKVGEKYRRLYGRSRTQAAGAERQPNASLLHKMLKINNYGIRRPEAAWSIALWPEATGSFSILHSPFSIVHCPLSIVHY